MSHQPHISHEKIKFRIDAKKAWSGFWLAFVVVWGGSLFALWKTHTSISNLPVWFLPLIVLFPFITPLARHAQGFTIDGDLVLIEFFFFKSKLPAQNIKSLSYEQCGRW